MLEPDYPVFVLTLAGDERRRQRLVEALDLRGIAHELFFGVDGRKGLPPEAERQIDRAGALTRNWRQLTDAEFACALSHLAIYATILDRGLPGAIVLEDDARIGDTFQHFVERKAWHCAEMILLAHHNTRVTRAAPRPVVDDVVGYRIALPPYGTVGYCLSARAAHTIRRRSLPLRATADWPCNIARLDCLAVMPRIVTFELDLKDTSVIDAGRRRAMGVRTPPRFASLRRLHLLDEWHLRLGRRLGRPLD